MWLSGTTQKSSWSAQNKQTSFNHCRNNRCVYWCFEERTVRCWRESQMNVFEPAHVITRMRLWYLSHRRPAKVQATHPCSLARAFAVRTHEVWGPTKNQISSPTEWLRMCIWRMSLRRTNSTIIYSGLSRKLTKEKTCLSKFPSFIIGQKVC